MVKTNAAVATYIANQSKWSRALGKLRKLLNQTELEESIRWGKPSYLHDGKILVTFSGFKEHFALWFHQGALLKDPLKKLVSGTEGVTRAQRQWRFTSEAEIHSAKIALYLKETIANHRAGKKVVAQKPIKKVTAIPLELKKALQADTALRANRMCSRVCGIGPSAADTTRIAPSICAAPVIMFFT